MSQDGLFFWGTTAQYPNGHLIKVSASDPLPTTGGGGGGGTQATNITQVNGSAIALGQTTSPNSFPVTIASDQSLAITGTVTCSGSVGLNAGSAIIGKVAIDQTTDGTTNAVHLVAGTAVAGKVGIDQTTNGTTNAVVIVPATSGGLLLSSTIWANAGVIVKSGAGQLYHIEAFNNSSTIAYLKIYNATSVVAGTGTPVWRQMVPAPAAGGAGFISVDCQGLAFSTGIAVFMTTGIADNDTGAVAGSTCLINFGYK